MKHGGELAGRDGGFDIARCAAELPGGRAFQPERNGRHFERDVEEGWRSSGGDSGVS